MSAAELEELAGQIRSKIIESVSNSGGHLASNLGAVELSIALHTVFDSPRDKVIWDVGHQAYAHKILTGRASRFDTLRQYQGISGYPSTEESVHDVYTTGHASTAMSAAIGMAKARDLRKQDHHVIAVVGDGALTGGISLEAINNAMHLNSNLIVVLNDNEMSISKNVGAFSDYFSRVRMNKLYTQTKDRVENMIKRIPRLGHPLFHIAEKLKNRMKHFIIDFQTEVIVEELGFQYLGPVDGHNITLVMSALAFAKEAKRPILVHLLTKKGKGYRIAEKDPTKFHGTGPFDVASGVPKKKNGKLTYTEVFGHELARMAENDDKVVAVTAAMTEGTGLDDFSKRFPSRFIDVGIAEEHAIIFASGLAKGGMVPFCAIYSTFLQRSFDQIFHDVCLQGAHVVFCMDRAGIVGDDGPTHNGVFDMAYMRAFPGIVVMAPKDDIELIDMMHTARQHNGPVSIRYPKTVIPGIHSSGTNPATIEIGKAELLLTQKPVKGKNVLIIAIGSMVLPSVEAANRLGKKGLSVSVINSRFIKPLDGGLIPEKASVADMIVTVEEGSLPGGFGSAVLELLEEKGISKKVMRIGIHDRFTEAGNRDFILSKYGLDADGIERAVENAFRS